MKILIATHNPGKAKELKKYLETWGTEALSLDDLNISDDIEETGQTFAENAFLKAKFFCQLSGLPTLADDSGLEIHALNNEPGVKSRRWKGYKMTDQELIDYTLERLAGIPDDQRTANFTVFLAVVLPDGQEFSSESKNFGLITAKQMAPIAPGYPFRAIFFSTEANKLLSEFTPEDEDKFHHRKRALEKLKPYLLK